MRPRRHVLAIWRLADGAGLRVLSPVSAAVLAALQAGDDLDAVAGDESDGALLQTEVFAAPFVRVAAKSL